MKWFSTGKRYRKQQSLLLICATAHTVERHTHNTYSLLSILAFIYWFIDWFFSSFITLRSGTMDDCYALNFRCVLLPHKLPATARKPSLPCYLPITGGGVCKCNELDRNSKRSTIYHSEPLSITRKLATESQLTRLHHKDEAVSQLNHLLLFRNQWSFFLRN